MNLNDYMYKGIKNIVNTAARFYLGNRKGQLFMIHMTSHLRKSAGIREQHEQSGIHVPPFLIASIASHCNLRCAGCYARAMGGCDSSDDKQQEMNGSDWQRLFEEASELGVSFILLAGGEPLLRRDIIGMAAERKDILFPVFTNGTLLDDEYLHIFDANRNIIPILSIEGKDEQTDARRGEGVSKMVWQVAGRLQKAGILYGASITVTSENIHDVTDPHFVNSLRQRGCGVIIYVEYVPAEENTDHLVLTDSDLSELQLRIGNLRNDKQNRGTIILSFPGDEDAMGGCLAAGRGFFHINAKGGAEPCPFSPFSIMSLKDNSLISVLQSPFFAEVCNISASETLNHYGGCTLFKHQDKVLSLLGSRLL